MLIHEKFGTKEILVKIMFVQNIWVQIIIGLKKILVERNCFSKIKIMVNKNMVSNEFLLKGI